MGKARDDHKAAGEESRRRRSKRPEAAGAEAVDMDYLAAVTAHVEKTVGPCGQVLQSQSPDHIQVDVLLINPDPERPWHTLVTCGMGARPMAAPPDRADEARLELAFCLPPDWPPLVSQGRGSWAPGPGAWIANSLTATAKLPFMFNTFFDEGRTTPNGDPPRPIAQGSRLCCGLLARPGRISHPSFPRLKLPDGSSVRFLSLIMLHQAEMDFKLRRGYEALMTRLEKNEVDELLILDRPSVCRGGLLGLLGF